MTHRLSGIKLESTEESYFEKLFNSNVEYLPSEHSETEGESPTFDEFLDSDITEDEARTQQLGI